VAVAVAHRQRLVQRLFQATLGRLLLNCYLVHGPADRVHLAPSATVANALFNTVSGEIHVGEHALYGHHVCLLTGTHDTALEGAARQWQVPREGRDIVIEDGAWLASNVTVLGPARIGRGAIVAAGAVVTGDVEPGARVGGIPARALQ
jgi:acetyltransferase-like isoleucine patch superfamily enzyme